MYPGTIINYIDNSRIDIPEPEVEISRRPLYLVANTFEKGPEKLRTVTGNEFFALYGTEMKFEKHGQAALQAARLIQSGASLWIKRLVGPNATLGNVVFAAKVVKEGTNVTLTWKKYSSKTAKKFSEIVSTANIPDDEIPVIIVGDNGRSSVSKSIRFIPDYNVSRGIGTVFYDLRIYEGSTELDREMVTLNPYIIYEDESYAITKDTSIQLEAYVDPANYDKLISTIVANVSTDEAPVSKETIMGLDLLNGYDVRGDVTDLFTVEYADTTVETTASFDFGATYGISLQNGNDGFTTNGVSTLSYDPYNPYAQVSDLMVDFFSGANEEDEEIYDIDNHRLFAMIDANYPQVVKDAIVDYMAFRNDSYYFRDLGVKDTETFIGIQAVKSIQKGKDYDNSFIFADYSTWGEVYDPETRKRITVTCMFDMAVTLTQHYIANPFSPTAGIFNGFYLDSFIQDTINFVPLKKPNINYKQAMADIKVNYAGNENGRYVIESLFTNNKIESQLSYISNVLAMQEIGRRVAEVCPECRFELYTTGSDFTNYRNKINRVLENYSSYFNTLELVYTSDPIRKAQKIFYAAINFAFGDWAQTEIFDLVANPSSISSLTSSVATEE